MCIRSHANCSYGLQLQVAWSLEHRHNPRVRVSCISVITAKYNTVLKSLGLGSLVFWVPGSLCPVFIVSLNSSR